MAKAETPDTTELEELAFRLYAERIAKQPAQVNGDQAALWSYRRAQEFLAMRDRVRAGESIATPTGPQLSEASAPNLPAKHPHNLVSQRFGNLPIPGFKDTGLARVRHINEWLNSHPRNQENTVAYEALDWDVPTTNLARELFPAYVTN